MTEWRSCLGDGDGDAAGAGANAGAGAGATHWPRRPAQLCVVFLTGFCRNVKSEFLAWVGKMAVGKGPCLCKPADLSSTPRTHVTMEIFHKAVLNSIHVLA